MDNDYSIILRINMLNFVKKTSSFLVLAFGKGVGFGNLIVETISLSKVLQATGKSTCFSPCHKHGQKTTHYCPQVNLKCPVENHQIVFYFRIFI
jgi:hypothetical protein